MILGYFLPGVVSLIAQVVGSLVGAAGVTVCFSELLWLLNIAYLKVKVLKGLRVLDIVCVFTGLAFIPMYWVLNAQWILNDLMAICAIVALMKLLKIRSLSMGLFL